MAFGFFRVAGLHAAGTDRDCNLFAFFGIYNGRKPSTSIFGITRSWYEDATTAGFYGELVEAAKPYGGAEGYVRSKLKEVRADG